MKLLIAFLLFCIPVFAQDAKVIESSTEDASQAQQLWNNLQSAQKEWDAFQESTKEKYTYVDENAPAEERGDAIVSTLLDSSGIGNLTVFGIGTISSCNVVGEAFCITPNHETLEKPKEPEKPKESEKPKEKIIFMRAGWENGLEFSKDFNYIVPKKFQNVSGTVWGNGNYCATPVPAISFN